MSAQSIDRAIQLFDAAKYAEAKTELVTVQNADNTNAVAAYYLGRIARIDNDGDEALHQFERAVQGDDRNALYHFWLGTAVSDAGQRSGTLRMAFMARRVRKEWERAVELDPNRVDARGGLAPFYAMAPGFWGGSMDKARAQAAEIAKRDATRGAMSHGLVARYEKNPRAEQAAYEQAIAFAPDSLPPYVGLADALVRSRNVAEAFATLDDYAKRRPDDHWALYQAGRIAGTSGLQLDRGERSLRQFLAAPPADAYAPTMAGAHYWLGQIAEKRGSKDVAREEYQAALKIDPKNPPARKAMESAK
jgi:tetratricopeptide (TPR) repeat protein